MAKVTIKVENPQPSRGLVNARRGYDGALRTCRLCGKPLVGHHKGICSKCMGRYDYGRSRLVLRGINAKAIARNAKKAANTIALQSLMESSTACSYCGVSPLAIGGKGWKW